MPRTRVTTTALALTLLCSPAAVLAVDLDDRLDRALRRVLDGEAPRCDKQFVLADLAGRPDRRFLNFSGDLSGRSIGALSAAASRREIHARRLHAPVSEALGHQLPDGSFGMRWSGNRVTDEVVAKMWGNGLLLVRLLDYYGLSRDRDALQAAVRLGDYILSRLPAFHKPGVTERFSRGRRALGCICWTQNVEGLSKLSAIAGEPRFLDGTREIAGHIRTTPGQHSHGLLTSLRGSLEIDSQDGDERWLRLAEGIWSKISDSRHLSPTGSVSDFLDPEPRRDEGCSVADWLPLSLDLWH